MELPSNFVDSNYEEKVSIGIELVKQKDHCQWQIGDLAASLMSDTEVSTDLNLARFAPAIGLQPRTLQGYVKLAKFWPVHYREDWPNLSYSHFKTAMHGSNKDLDKAIRLMDYASDKGLSIGSFEAWIKETAQSELDCLRLRNLELTDLLAQIYPVLVESGQGALAKRIATTLKLNVTL